MAPNTRATFTVIVNYNTMSDPVKLFFGPELPAWFRDEIQEDPETKEQRSAADLSALVLFNCLAAPSTPLVFLWPPPQFPR